MGCTKRGGDSIKINKRLLTLAAVAAALVISTALIVSMSGNDKPKVTTNPPAEDQVPQSSPVTPVQNAANAPAADQNLPSESDEPATDRPGHGHHNGNGNGNGNGGDDSDTSDAKLHGLARAAYVHQRNLDRMQDKGKTAPHGLLDSTAKLTAMNLERMSADDGQNVHTDNGKHTGQQQGHSHGDT